VSLQTFFNNFALLADAPNGVAKLRELMLQLAIRGQLDTQNNDDELAMDLARKIQFHRTRLIKNKQIRNTKPLPAIHSSEIPFDIPQNWQWIRLGEIGDWGAGATPDRKNLKYYGGNFRWFKSGELNDGYIHESEETITDLALKECSLRLNKPGDVLIAMYGATIGKLAILETEATTNQAVCACTCFDGFYNQFLLVLLRAYKSHFTGRGAGGAQPNISREKIIHTVAPLPPLEEQKRIVVKVNELTRLCDELEARQQARRESRVRLNHAMLAPLNNAALLAPEEFEQASVRLADNFSALYDSAETVSRLRSTILQLAVQGRLVPQDPNDEPASVLLEKIKKEKALLAEERNIKRAGEELAQIDVAEQPYLLATGWKWCRIGDFALVRGGKRLPSGASFSLVPTSRIYIQVTNMKKGTIIRDNLKYIDESVFGSIKQYTIEKEDIYITIAGTIGQAGEVPDFFHGMNLTENAAKLMFRGLDKDYFLLALTSDTLQKQFNQKTNQMAQPKLALKRVADALLPLPPLAEQKRIVAKVNQLMALCDELETKLRQAEADSKKLMKAAVRDVLASISLESAEEPLSVVA
jgi:type I restriction enzyme S subunit